MGLQRDLEELNRLRQSAIVGATVIVLSNLIPLAGVLWWGWDAYVIVFLYWLENGVIGVVNFLKIRKIETERGGGVGFTISGFFVLHYGIFWLVHGIFVFLLPVFAGIGSASGSGFGFELAFLHVSPAGLLIALAGLAAAHVGNYLFVFLRERQYLTMDAGRQMLAPYPRLITLHVVIILGAVLAGLFGEPLWLVVLLVLFKIAFDLGAFLFARRFQWVTISNIGGGSGRLG